MVLRHQSLAITLGRLLSVLIPESGNLPFICTGIFIPGHEVLIVHFLQLYLQGINLIWSFL